MNLNRAMVNICHSSIFVYLRINKENKRKISQRCLILRTKKEGKQTVFFENSPHIIATNAIAGTKEGEGPLGEFFDETAPDDLWGEKSWEKAESKFMQQTILSALKKSNLHPADIDYIFAGDLLNQCAGTNYGIRVFSIPFIGLYGACSTMGLSMKMAAMAIDGGFADRCIAVTSSHFCSAERQFRFPLEYGGQRPPSAQWTVTGSACVILDKNKGDFKVECATTGKIVDLGITDANNMGAAMAPAAVDCLCAHFADTGRNPKDYDAIFTGDLGKIGKSIVIDQMKENGYDLSNNYTDCGVLMFDNSQDVHSGASGCACSGLVLCAHILPKLKNGVWKKILFVPTGALMSTTAIQQGESIPSIAHAVSITI